MKKSNFEIGEKVFVIEKYENKRINWLDEMDEFLNHTFTIIDNFEKSFLLEYEKSHYDICYWFAEESLLSMSDLRKRKLKNLITNDGD